MIPPSLDLKHADESTYVVRTEDQTQDEVLKSGFSLQKLVSTTGQPSPAIKLGGAGFKVYRVASLRGKGQTSSPKMPMRLMMPPAFWGSLP